MKTHTRRHKLEKPLAEKTISSTDLLFLILYSNSFGPVPTSVQEKVIPSCPSSSFQLPSGISLQLPPSRKPEHQGTNFAANASSPRSLQGQSHYKSSKPEVYPATQNSHQWDWSMPATTIRLKPKCLSNVLVTNIAFLQVPLPQYWLLMTSWSVFAS